MNYNQLASHNAKIERICNTGRQGHAEQTAPPPNELQSPNHAPRHPAPHPCATRGGHRYKPRPGPRRHHLTHAADTGHTSPQRRHQHKAPCIVPLPGAAAATYNTPQTKATLPCINLRYKAGWLYFLLEQKLNQNRMESGPCVINRLRNRWDQCQRQICVHS